MIGLLPTDAVWTWLVALLLLATATTVSSRRTAKLLLLLVSVVVVVLGHFGLELPLRLVCDSASHNNQGARGELVYKDVVLHDSSPVHNLNRPHVTKFSDEDALEVTNGDVLAKIHIDTLTLRGAKADKHDDVILVTFFSCFNDGVKGV